MNNERYFPGKIILFGEYSVLHGSHAALVPYRGVSLSFITDPGSESNRVLSSFTKHLEDTPQLKEYINTAKLGKDIMDGLAVRSSIPRNKGLGSSGAICAAIYHGYGLKTLTGDESLRSIFALMETWFHGKSSGIDPLCIYFDRPLMLKNDIFLLADAEPTNTVSNFLIDTGIQSRTGPLVEYFTDLMSRKKFRMDFLGNYIPLVNEAVREWWEGRLSMKTVIEVSKAQQIYFESMFPKAFKHIWKTGMDKELYALKICGSGGGGMLLGFTGDLEATSEFLKKEFNIAIVPQMH